MKASNQQQLWELMSAAGVEGAVIDPNDRVGHKNRYIIETRTAAIMEALGNLPASSLVLDFGCGTGIMTRTFATAGWRAIGVDISPSLLHTGLLQHPGEWLMSCYDGARLPLQDSSMDAAVTYVVLNHITDDQHLLSCLRELHRVLRPGGHLVATEQVKRKRSVSMDGLKVQRPMAEFITLLEAAGFAVEHHKLTRFGHFPFIYLVRYGLVPRRLAPWISRLERWLAASRNTEPRFDYADALFFARKKQSVDSPAPAV